MISVFLLLEVAATLLFIGAAVAGLAPAHRFPLAPVAERLRRW